MAKQKKQLEYAYAADPNKFNLRFYQRYDENFLYNKALTLAVVLANAERFKAQVAEYQDIDPNRVDDKFFESLQAELHFTEMHQFEGFFALLIAVFQEQPDWIYLTDYTTREMKDAIKLFIAGRSHIKTLSNEKVETEREFISNAVYDSYMPQGEEQNDSWNANLDNIAWLIRHMAERYIAGSEYNAYKHGLRVMTGQSSFGLRLENPPGTPVGPLRILSSSKDSLSYLEVKEQVMLLPQDYQTQQENGMEQSNATQPCGVSQSKEEKNQIKVKRVYETTKHFNPQESLTYLSIMNRLLSTIKRTRLAYFNDGSVLEELANFSNLDKDQLLALGAQSHFQTSFSV
jgi:hypothetical protein